MKFKTLQAGKRFTIDFLHDDDTWFIKLDDYPKRNSKMIKGDNVGQVITVHGNTDIKEIDDGI